MIALLTATQANASIIVQSESGSLGFISWFMSLVQPVLEMEVGWLVTLITVSPTIYCWPDEALPPKNCRVSAGLDKLLPYFIDILVPLYIAAILFTALYFIVKSTNPRGRARAKSMLSKLLFSMVLVTMSPVIYQMMIDTSNAFVDAMYKEPALGLQDMSSLTKAATAGELFGVCCLILFVMLVIAVAAIMVAIRYYFVVVFGALFPILLFLYFFDLTRSWGRKYIREAFNWIFTPVMQMFWLAFAMKALDATGPVFSSIDPAIFGTEIMGAIISLGMALVGFIMVAISPLTMNHLMGLIGGGIFAIGVASSTPWVAAVGGVMQGRQDAGLHAAKSVLTRATPSASAYRGIMYGYGPGLGRDSIAFSPESVSMMDGGSPGGGGGGGGGEEGGESEGGGYGGAGGGGGGGAGGGGPGGVSTVGVTAPGGARGGRAGKKGPSDRQLAAEAANKAIKATEEGTGVTEARGFDPTAAPPPSQGRMREGLPRNIGEALSRAYPESPQTHAKEAQAAPPSSMPMGIPLAFRQRAQPKAVPGAPKPLIGKPAEQAGTEEEVVKDAAAEAEREVARAEKEIAFEKTQVGYEVVRKRVEQVGKEYEGGLDRIREKAKKARKEKEDKG